MSVKKLPQDALGIVNSFLTPGEFYNLKTAMADRSRSDDENSEYWHAPPGLLRAVRAQCPTLIRWCARQAPAEDILAAAEFVSSEPAARALISSCPKHAMAHLIERAIVHDKFYLFMQLLPLADVPFDTIYEHMRWIYLARAFQWAPRPFIRWIFGDFHDAADPEIVRDLRYVFGHIDTRAKQVLSTVLGRYHEWLWCEKTDRAATLQTIVAIHSLIVDGHPVISFQPERYIQPAIASPNPQYLEFLLARDLEVTPEIIKNVYDIKKIQLLVAAQYAQKYQKIMIMLFILIFVLIMNINTAKTVHSI